MIASVSAKVVYIYHFTFFESTEFVSPDAGYIFPEFRVPSIEKRNSECPWGPRGRTQVAEEHFGGGGHAKAATPFLDPTVKFNDEKTNIKIVENALTQDASLSESSTKGERTRMRFTATNLLCAMDQILKMSESPPKAEGPSLSWTVETRRSIDPKSGKISLNHCRRGA